MAGEQPADQSLYDFLIEDHEVMPAPPPGHLDFTGRPQQPTAAANRTSDERQLPNAPSNPRNIPAPATAPPMLPLPDLADPSRAESRLHHPNNDLHAQSLPTTGSFFARPPIPTSVGHFPIDWNLYGTVHPGAPLDQTPFQFEVPPPNSLLDHVSHHQPADPGLAYGSDLVSPTSIHPVTHNQYAFSVPWEDGTGHETTTPTAMTPATQVSSNPWVDPEDAQYGEESESNSRSKQKSRQKRAKRNAHRPSESSAGASTAPTSPSSVSQQSRRPSVGSKSVSVASTGSTASSRPSKLRSASRTSKNNVNKPSDTPEERRTRASHNLVEKQYRNRLNAQFESLLNALPEQIRSAGDGEESEGPVDFGDRRVSKGEVLEMARKHIQTLEQERNQLEKEKNQLLGNLKQLQGSTSGGSSEGPSSGTPLEFNITMDDEKGNDEMDDEDEDEEKKK